MLSQPSPREIRLLSSKPLFQGVPEEQLLCFAQATCLQKFPGGTDILTLQEQAGMVFVIVSGSVKVYLPQQGAISGKLETILCILGPGELLGELSAIDGEGHSASVTTLEATRCVCISDRHFRQCLHQVPTLNYNVLRMVIRRLRLLTSKTQTLCTLDVAGRLAQQLLLFAEYYGEPDEHGYTVLPLRLTQSNLAGLIGASRERVNRAMNLYKRQGCLSVHEGFRITLHDLEALRRACHP